jgi:D-sedoheptulose 7-phosphate isomerase
MIDMTLGMRSSLLGSILSNAEATSQSGKAVAVETCISEILTLLRNLRTRKGSLYVIGNGGSAAVAGHSVTDFLNVAQLRATTLHDPALMTCMANDFGFENAFARIISVIAKPDDVLIAISSSGNSQNIRNAVLKMRELSGFALTLSGFASTNPLRKLGDMNVWLNTTDYGMAEIGHQFFLHNIADRLRIENELNSVKQ